MLGLRLETFCKKKNEYNENNCVIHYTCIWTVVGGQAGFTKYNK